MKSLFLASMGLAGGLLLMPQAWAQSDKQATSQKGAAAPAAADDSAGTTIVGDRESPIGLYLTPWKNEYAQRGMDRPAQIVQEQMAPIDPGVFRRQNSYYDTITAYRQAELGNKK
jgi:hypothetical protein